MTLQTHKIWAICGAEKKRAPIFIEKSGHGSETKIAAKTHGKNIDFETTSAKSSDIMIMKALYPKS